MIIVAGGVGSNGFLRCLLFAAKNRNRKTRRIATKNFRWKILVKMKRKNKLEKENLQKR